MKRFSCCFSLTWASQISQIWGDSLSSRPGALGTVLDRTSAGASPGPLFVPQKNKPASSGPEFSFSTTSLLCRCCVFGEICVCGFQAPSSECVVCGLSQTWALLACNKAANPNCRKIQIIFLASQGLRKCLII